MKDNTHDFLQKGWVVAFCAMICCFLWGSAFPCIKIGYGMFEIAASDTASQILFAGTRFALAGVLTITIGSLLSHRVLWPARTSWGMIFKLCLAQTVIHYLLFYVGLAHTSGVKGSILQSTNVFFSILISALIFHFEKMSIGKLLGCLFGFIGVVFINLNGGTISGSISFLGEGFIVLSSLSSALSSVLIKKFSQTENPVTLSGFQFMTGGLIMVAVGLSAGGKLQGFAPSSVMLLIYMAMISAVAYSLWGILLKHNPVGRVAVFGFMNPVFGVSLSAILLKEQNQAFSFQGAISLVLVCLGIYLVNRDVSFAKSKSEN